MIYTDALFLMTRDSGFIAVVLFTIKFLSLQHACFCKHERSRRFSTTGLCLNMHVSLDRGQNELCILYRQTFSGSIRKINCLHWIGISPLQPSRET